MSPSARTSPGPTYDRAAWSWVEHLRSGGTTPWAGWVRSGAGPDAVVPEDQPVPGAARLELLRRLWQEQPPDEVTRASLVDLLLARSGPGRGLAEQPLSWPGLRPGFGPPPTDPEEVPDVELLRLGAGVLAELVLAAAPAPEPALPRRRVLGRVPAFVLMGAPVTTAVVRRALADAGHVEGGRAPMTLLFAEPLDVALGQVWSARVQRGAAVRWPGFVDRWAHRPGLPPSIDVVAAARRRAARTDAHRVHVVVGGSDAVGTAGEVLGVATAGSVRAAASSRPRPLSPAASDVARRVNAVLHLKVPADRLSAVAGAAAGLLASCDAPVSAPLAVPGPFRDWVTDTAARQAEGILGGGYPVHGEPGLLVPAPPGRPARPDPAAAVHVMLRACLAQAARTAQQRRTEAR